MQRKRPQFKRRKFKPTSNRKLSIRDFAILEFLWTWKIASSPILKEHALKGKTEWWAYKALRRLEKERYLLRLPRGNVLEQELWTLTDIGFEVVLMNRDDIKQYRYRVHAPAHDYLGTCLQLGEVWQSSAEKMFYTEQMLASLAPSNFPKSFRKFPSHVPDGVTIFQVGRQEAIVGYEVDLNLKDEERYENTFQYYFEGIQPHLIVWLVSNRWIANRIRQAYLEVAYGDRKELFNKKVAFVLVEDFKQKVWEALVLDGPMKGLSIRNIHSNLLQNQIKLNSNIGQKSLQAIFFPKFKSPQKSLV